MLDGIELRGQEAAVISTPLPSDSIKIDSLEDDFNYRFGIDDENFLGNNSEIRLYGIKKKQVPPGTFASNCKEGEYIPQMIAPYHKLDIYTIFGNPWHLDYRYRF